MGRICLHQILGTWEPGLGTILSRNTLVVASRDLRVYQFKSANLKPFQTAVILKEHSYAPSIIQARDSRTVMTIHVPFQFLGLQILFCKAKSAAQHQTVFK